VSSIPFNGVLAFNLFLMLQAPMAKHGEPERTEPGVFHAFRPATSLDGFATSQDQPPHALIDFGGSIATIQKVFPDLALPSHPACD
jgi:hypothetical protein